jgi:hypothetical protein
MPYADEARSRENQDTIGGRDVVPSRNPNRERGRRGAAGCRLRYTALNRQHRRDDERRGLGCLDAANLCSAGVRLGSGSFSGRLERRFRWLPGRLTAANTTIRTAGASSAAIATDRGGGTITVSGGTMTTTGYHSPGIYSTGTITVTGSNINATACEAAVVEGKNSIVVRNSKLSGAKNRGVMLYQSMSGDAGVGTASYQMIGGSLYATQGPAFYITNTTARITLRSGALVHAASGVLLRADNAGTGSGNTGAGVATLIASGEKLTGDIVTAGTGSASISLTNATTLAGSITRAALTLDRTSTWRVTSNSKLTAFSDQAAISGNRILNVVGDGRTVTYDASLAANKALGGKTYHLTGGGTLAPAG